MPHYLTFGIRIPAALADCLSSIAFVRATTNENLPSGGYKHTIPTDPGNQACVLPVTPRREGAPMELTPEQQFDDISKLISDLSKNSKEFQLLCKDKVSTPTENTAKSATQKPTEQVLSTEASAKEQQQADCPLFSKLPSEIRNMIYHHVLVSSNPIQPAYEMNGCSRTKWRNKRKAGLLQPNDVRFPEDIDSAILQTCRRAYEEGISILYGENTFLFASHSDIYYFQRGGIDYEKFTKSAKSKHKRLGLVRKAVLEMQQHTYFELLYSQWSWFIDPDEDSIPNIHFPALEVLTVDSSGLKLPDEEVPMINMFITKIATFGKLKRLSVPGIIHKPTLQRMKEELIRDDGLLESTVFDTDIEKSNAEEWEGW